MGVEIPGTKITELLIAITLGALIGKSEYELKVLRDFDTNDLAEAKRFINEDKISIVTTLPVLFYAEEMGVDNETLIRPLVLSSLVVIYLKLHLRRLSALCGCLVMSTGSSCGITYLIGGTYEQIAFCLNSNRK